MKKKVFSYLLMLMAIIMGSSVMHAQQMPQLTPLPDMPGLRAGVLPNGLHYYVLHNEEPKGRANFYIAQKVGSTLETKDQLGLAHFLEHMAFNGTTTYPGKTMLNYLQSKGIRFGADINAYTDFDETVYNINHVPTSDVALMDSVLLVLRDWSGSLLLEDDEIEAERGVIQEEWRMRNTANNRFYSAMLPVVYDEYQYQQSPIGTMEVVMNFKPDVLRDYYHKWYRPDQQGIVVVGDFDAAEMEKKVIDIFSAIPMPENAAERTYATVSDNKEPIYFEFEDPEMKFSYIMMAFKSDRLPFEMRNTLEAGLMSQVLQNVVAMLINNRLSEHAKSADCKYMQAGCEFTTFEVSKTKDAFYVRIVPKDDPEAAFRDAMAIVARACKTGFTTSELERVQSELLTAYESAYNERDKTDSEDRAREIIRHFIENEPAPGAEFEYQFVSSVLPQIPVEQYNMIAAELLTPENEVVVVAQPKAEGYKLPGRESMLTALNEVLNAQYEAYVDEVITDPLLDSLLAPGKIVSEKKNDLYGTTEFMLSNGVKVVVKPTDFNADQIQLQYFRMGGYRNFDPADVANLRQLDQAYESSKLGNFNVKTLTKYLAGKHVGLGFGMGQATTSFEGVSTVKDFPTLMELLYASNVALGVDQEQYDVNLGNLVKQLTLSEANPDFTFQTMQAKGMWGGNPMMMPATAAEVQKADYPKMVEMIKQLTSNAADYTLLIVGNVDLDTLRPLLEQYVASLPSTGKKSELPVVNKIAMPEGQVDQIADVPMQTPIVKVMNLFDGSNLEYNVANNVQISILGEILTNVYTNTLREEEGGTYSPGAFGTMFPNSDQWMFGYFFLTNSDMSQRLQERAYKEAMELLANGASADDFNKVKEAEAAQFAIALRNNGYWLQNLMLIERGWDLITGREEYLKNLKVEDFNNYIKTIYNGKNRIQIVMNGVEAK